MLESIQDAAGRIDGHRLWDRLMQMAQIGAIPGNGVNRPALSADDIRARRLLIGWARSRGFGVGVDAIGNLFVRREGIDRSAAPVMAGSHMDSQPRGGRFDGIYGVIAALEALEAIDAAGVKTRRPVEMVAWTNEEGGRFQPCTMGSAVFTGQRGLDDARLGDLLPELPDLGGQQIDGALLGVDDLAELLEQVLLLGEADLQLDDAIFHVQALPVRLNDVVSSSNRPCRFQRNFNR